MKRWTKSWPEWSLTKPEHHPSFLPTQLRIADIWLDKVRAFLINPTAGEIRLPKLVFFSQLRRSVQIFKLFAFVLSFSSSRKAPSLSYCLNSLLYSSFAMLPSVANSLEGYNPFSGFPVSRTFFATAL
jgi:hypothetical protein